MNSLVTDKNSERRTWMYNYAKLKKLYRLYRKEKAVALRDEKNRYVEERKAQRNLFRPWRNYNEKECLKYAHKKLERYLALDQKILSHFDTVIEYYDDYERDQDVDVRHIEVDAMEMAVIKMFEGIHTYCVSNVMDHVDLSYDREHDNDEQQSRS